MTADETSNNGSHILKKHVTDRITEWAMQQNDDRKCGQIVGQKFCTCDCCEPDNDAGKPGV